MKFKLKNVLIVFRKELLDVLRDRRTIISMIVVPIFLMPVITLGVGWFTKKQITKMQQEQAVVVLLGGERFPMLKEELAKAERLQIMDNLQDTAAAMKLLRSESVRAVVEIPSQWNVEAANSHSLPLDSIHVYYFASKDESEFAYGRISDAIRKVRDKYTENVITNAGLPVQTLKPFFIAPVNVSTPSELGGKLIGMFLPYMMIILSLTGAMYPAVDLTAGEKERGTLETLLISPATRSELVFGKFLTVMLISLATAMLTLLSYVLMSKGILFSVPAEVLTKINFHISPMAIIATAMLFIPLSATFSSLLMAIGILAKSYKEAQSYISPMMIVVILPAMASIMPGMKTNLLYSLIPLLNVSMLVKDAFTGNLNPLYLAVATLSTVLVAAIALRICITTFNKESVLFRV